MAFRVSKRESRMLVGFVVLVALYLLYSQVHIPLNARLAALNSEIGVSRLRADTMRQTALSLTVLENELNNLHRRLQIIWRGVGQEPDVAALVRSLESYSVGAGASLTSFRPLAVAVGRFVAEMPFELTLQGSFDSVLTFLRQAEEGSPAVVFTGIRVDVFASDTLFSAPELNAVISGKTYHRAQNQANAGVRGGA